MSEPLLAVDDLQVEFRTEEGVVNAVDGVTYVIGRGEVLAILGESGSGKTVHARAIMRILDSPPAHITGGSARLRDIDVLTLDEDDMREIRGSKIAMLFQDPHSALDPVFTIGDQMIELLQTRKGMS
jgi:oligopeptide transport system ATP-binding protein